MKSGMPCCRSRRTRQHDLVDSGPAHSMMKKGIRHHTKETPSHSLVSFNTTPLLGRKKVYSSHGSRIPKTDPEPKRHYRQTCAMVPFSIGIRLWGSPQGRQITSSHWRVILFKNNRGRPNAHGWRLICPRYRRAGKLWKSIHVINSYDNKKTPLRATKEQPLYAPLTEKELFARTETRRILPNCSTQCGTNERGILHRQPGNFSPKIDGRMSYPNLGTWKTSCTRLIPRTSPKDSRTPRTAKYVWQT